MSVARQYLDGLCRTYGGAEAPAAAVDELLRLAPPESHAQGAVLAREGEPADRAFFVVEGEIEASIAAGTAADGAGGGPAARRLVVNRAVPGEFMGEAALFLTAGRRMATLVAARASTVLVFRRELFRASASNPALIAVEQHVLRVLVKRIANTDAHVTRAWREAGGGPAAGDGLAALLGAGR